nr:MAG TPA: hypothetical protein [Caudoviricetes sp.]
MVPPVQFWKISIVTYYELWEQANLQQLYTLFLMARHIQRIPGVAN